MIRLKVSKPKYDKTQQNIVFILGDILYVAFVYTVASALLSRNAFLFFIMSCFDKSCLALLLITNFRPLIILESIWILLSRDFIESLVSFSRLFFPLNDFFAFFSSLLGVLGKIFRLALLDRVASDSTEKCVSFEKFSFNSFLTFESKLCLSVHSISSGNKVSFIISVSIFSRNFS